MPDRTERSHACRVALGKRLVAHYGPTEAARRMADGFLLTREAAGWVTLYGAIRFAAWRIKVIAWCVAPLKMLGSFLLLLWSPKGTP